MSRLSFSRSWLVRVARLACAALALSCAGPSDGDTPPGSVTLALRSDAGQGQYQLTGTLTLMRDGTPYLVTRSLNGELSTLPVTVPAGTYTATVSSYTLTRVSDSPPRAITVLTPPTVSPTPIVVRSSETTFVTITFVLDDGEVVVFGPGTAAIRVTVNDDALTCGGCPDGDRCVAPQGDGRHLCVTPCDPMALRPCGGSGAKCDLPYFTEAGESLYVCNKVVSMSAGTAHTCAVQLSGDVWCWGWNNEGELGDGTRNRSVTPVRALGVTGASRVSAGAHLTCAIVRGQVWCWGNDRLNPELVPGLSDATSVSAGSEYACALRSGGEVVCWGDLNALHNDSSPQPSISETPLSAGIFNATYLTTSDDYACVTVPANPGSDALCWGRGFYTPSARTSSGALARVMGSVVNGGISGSAAQTCTLSTSGVVSCAGSAHVFFSTVLTNPTFSDGVSVDAGSGFACLLRQGGQVACWGTNGLGQLGNGTLTDAEYNSPPTAVSSLSDAVALSAGYTHACALRRTGRVVCWGQANMNGSTSNQSTPIPINGM